MISKKCLSCNNEFSISPYREKTAFYCSLECKFYHKNTQVTKNCRKCNKEFTVYISRKDKAEYCSTKCRGQVHYNIEKPCKYCQKIFKPEGVSSKFCSLYCSLHSKIDKTPIYLKPDCWLWTARKDKNGYGKITFKGKTLKAHRAIYELHYNTAIPNGMLICHTCDTPSCVNPEHLFQDTVLGNNRDKIAKGRAVYGFKPGHKGFRKKS
jgi:hypothetical protein